VVGLEMHSCDFHKKQLHNSGKLLPLAANGGLEVERNPPAALNAYVPSRLAVSSVSERRTVLRTAFGMKCAHPSIAGHYVQALYSPLGFASERDG
jgi:hypothetical protein